MDVPADVLGALDLGDWRSSRTEVGAPWRVDFAASRDIVFHAPTSARLVPPCAVRLAHPQGALY